MTEDCRPLLAMAVYEGFGIVVWVALLARAKERLRLQRWQARYSFGPPVNWCKPGLKYIVWHPGLLTGLLNFLNLPGHAQRDLELRLTCESCMSGSLTPCRDHRETEWPWRLKVKPAGNRNIKRNKYLV